MHFDRKYELSSCALLLLDSTYAFCLREYVTGFAKTDRIVTTTEIQFNV